ncbi:MAG: hypothetical protein K6L80_12140 [Agarilytica sp.]
MRSKILVLLILLVSSFSYAGNPIYMGAERKGFTISVESAIDIARPHFYQSFRLRNPSSEVTEKEYIDNKYYQIFVYLDDGKYLIFRDFPKKMASQHFSSPVVVDIFSGALNEPKQSHNK